MKRLKESFPVLHLSCASCASSAETVLKSQEGVLNASVNFANASALIEYAPQKTSKETLQKALQAVGYDLLIDASPQAQENLENIQLKALRRLQTRALWAFIFALPTLVLGMFLMHLPFANPLMWAFSTPVIWFGRSFFVQAWQQALRRTANMDTLVALSAGVAYLFSAFNTLFPHFWHASGAHAHVYFEASAAVIAFVLVGKLLEERAKSNTSTALRKLMGLQPKNVFAVLPDGALQEKPIEQIAAGEVLLAKAGERIAVDGEILQGESYLDESMMTGEPLPVPKVAGDKVLAGTINQKNALQYRAVRVGKDTRLAQIIRMVREAQGSKAPVQRLADRISRFFVPIVILLAVLACAFWAIFGGANGFSQGFLALVTVLVIACPCALGLATPTAVMVGVGKGAEHGILIKDAESLELAQRIDLVILDKTGTITEGKPVVTAIFWRDTPSEQRLAYLHAIEAQSEHPLAGAIVDFLAGKNVSKGLPALENFENLVGKGAKAVIAGETFCVGNASLLKNNGIAISPTLQERFEMLSHEAKTLVWFADAQDALALIAIEDRIRPTSAQAIAELRAMGIEIVMLTGDNNATAKAIAEQTGINRYRAEVLPAQKAEIVREWQAKGKIVAMVGDGINDSAALAQANVGVAMGKGADIAIDVAKMTLMSSDLLRLPEAIRLSSLTVKTIKQNLFWAFVYNLIGIPIAMGALYPLGIALNPMIASLAMVLSSISVVSNSLRLKMKRV